MNKDLLQIICDRLLFSEEYETIMNLTCLDSFLFNNLIIKKNFSNIKENRNKFIHTNNIEDDYLFEFRRYNETDEKYLSRIKDPYDIKLWSNLVYLEINDHEDIIENADNIEILIIMKKDYQFPTSFEGFKKLKTLQARNYLFFNHIKGDSLLELDISGEDVHITNDQLNCFTKIQKLNLSQNSSITNLDKFALTLEELDVSNQTLFIKDGYLTHCKLQKLKILNIANNKNDINSSNYIIFPDNICQTLLVLDASYDTTITSLEISKCEKLIELDLRSCHKIMIKILPPSLKKLNLSNNKIITDEDIKHLALEYLNLDYNILITDLQPFRFTLKHLSIDDPIMIDRSEFPFLKIIE